MTKAAISFNVPDGLRSSFRKQTDELFISRAPFLNYMIGRELRNLKEELAGLRLSLRAKWHMGAWTRAKLQPMRLAGLCGARGTRFRLPTSIA